MREYLRDTPQQSIYLATATIYNFALLQFPIFELSLQLLRFSHLAYCLVHIILVDPVPRVLDCEQATIGDRASLHRTYLGTGMDLRFCNDISQVSTVQLVTHFYNALKVYFSVQSHATCVDLENLQTPHFIGKRYLNFSV